MTTPIPMLLFCPTCGKRHIDDGEFATKPHHTHACQHCGMVWRPSIENTVGVQFLPGFKNGESVHSDQHIAALNARLVKLQTKISRLAFVVEALMCKELPLAKDGNADQVALADAIIEQLEEMVKEEGRKVEVVKEAPSSQRSRDSKRMTNKAGLMLTQICLEGGESAYVTHCELLQYEADAVNFLKSHGVDKKPLGGWPICESDVNVTRDKIVERFKRMDREGVVTIELTDPLGFEGFQFLPPPTPPIPPDTPTRPDAGRMVNHHGLLLTEITVDGIGSVYAAHREPFTKDAEAQEFLTKHDIAGIVVSACPIQRSEKMLDEDVRKMFERRVEEGVVTIL